MPDTPVPESNDVSNVPIVCSPVSDVPDVLPDLQTCLPQEAQPQDLPQKAYKDPSVTRDRLQIIIDETSPISCRPKQQGTMLSLDCVRHNKA